MTTKTFNCVEYQRKVRENFLKEADYDFGKFKILIREKIDNSEFVKQFKDSLKQN